MLPVGKTFRTLIAVAFAVGGLNAVEANSFYNITAFSSPQFTYSNAASANAHGEVVGYGHNPSAWPTIQSIRFGSTSTEVIGGFYAADNNDFGEIVGRDSGPFGNSTPHAVVYTRDGGVSRIQGLNDYYGSYALGINNSSQVVGFSATSAGLAAFSYSAGNLTWIPNPFGGANITARAISNLGHITGGAAAPGGGQAYLHKDGVTVGIGTLGGKDGYGLSVNDAGHVAGQSLTESGEAHAFLYSDGLMTDIGPMGSSFSTATGINISNHVVGYASSIRNGSADHFAFLYSSGTTVDLNSLIDPESGWLLKTAHAINDNGQISVTGCRASGCSALLLSPVPEPTAGGLFTAGLCLVLMTKLHRSRNFRRKFQS